jgi:hypothetical protein
MSWKDGFKAALLKYIKSCGRENAVEILSWDEEITSGDMGGCDTCGWGADEPYELAIYYLTEDGVRSVYTTTTPFGELLDYLTD